MVRTANIASIDSIRSTFSHESWFISVLSIIVLEPILLHQIYHFQSQIDSILELLIFYKEKRFDTKLHDIYEAQLNVNILRLYVKVSSIESFNIFVIYKKCIL